ncbi:hypothetical protein BT93_C2506 [Corymbia citriodora subsp. variegata]|nr:hypothetical protein BT93_C2506 [Corymbia citriodora subsp. variegata]
MGIRPRSNAERLRTIWTPEMDRCFIDLMLEQVSQGNRVDDNLFSKRAWKHMMLLFNAKFKFQYEKDVLKNRHKSLRNLYRAIKNLLEQEGFSWDETREMVIADNKVWDDYIKVHPDARSYRIKSISYYRDLCRIYGNSSLEQKGNNAPESTLHSADNVTVMLPDGIGEEGADPLPDITIDEDFGISVPEGVAEIISTSQDEPNVVGSSVGTRTRTYWQPTMDRYFIDLMLEQVQKGNQVDGLFLKQAWMEMIASFNAKFGFSYEVEILKNRYKTLRRQFNVINNLLDTEGFSWDDSRQMVTADDYIWQDYIKAHSDARQFMTRPVPYYNDICIICRDPSINEREFLLGQNVEQPSEVAVAKDQWASKTSHSPSALISGVVQDDNSQDPGKRGSKMPISRKRQFKDQSDIGPQIKCLKKTIEGTVSSQLEMATAAACLSDKKKDDDHSNSIQIEQVIEAVQALPDMDDDLILDACDFLEDEMKSKTFMALDVKLRKKWLLRKLRPESH